jgi:hypothetical protein
VVYIHGTTRTDLCYSSDVFITVLLGETKVFVQTKSHIVSIQTIGSQAEMEKVLFKGCCDG